LNVFTQLYSIGERSFVGGPLLQNITTKCKNCKELKMNELEVLELAIEETINHFISKMDNSDGLWDKDEEHDEWVSEMKDRMIERARCHLDIDPEPFSYKIEDKWRKTRLIVRVWEIMLRHNQENGEYSSGDMHKELVLHYIRHLERQLGIPIEEGCLKEINN